MLTMIVVLCSLTNPNACDDWTMPLTENVTPFQCIAKAQETFLSQMPDPTAMGKRIARISCAPSKSKFRNA
jgi:hypothetical protein